MTTATATRRLAAILAADVVGYSRLMGEDEEGTHERLSAHLRELVDPKIEEHHGRTVKNTGDGLLAEFPSVVAAVRCAVEVQRGMIDREPEVPEERRIRFRIGVNLGDVIVEEHDIFGDGVNVAARLEALAEPGGICVSRMVRDQIRDKLPYPFDDMGEQNVKNIARPLRAYALRPEGLAAPSRSGLPDEPSRRGRTVIGASAVAALVIVCLAWWLWPAATFFSRTGKPADQATASATPMPTPPAATSIQRPLVVPRLSIVVLPFTNLSNDSEQQYFADGITEDVTTDLSRLENMFVISRNTAFTYRNKPADTKQIGRELGVRYALEGSVRRSGSQVRVSAQLINAETDAHLWAERFDGDMGDLFALQNEITSRIANALNIELIAAESARKTEHPDVLDYIFRGRAALLKPDSRDSYAEAISVFEHALALDPQSVEAQTRLAGSLVTRVLVGLSDSRAADLARADQLIGRALAISPRYALAHEVKGDVLGARNRWEEAIPEFETALASNPDLLGALNSLGWCKLYAGSIEEVIPLAEQAIRRSPRDPRIGTWYGTIGNVHLLQSHPEEAILWLEKARNAAPAKPFNHTALAAAYALSGDLSRAAAELAEARRLRGERSFSSIAKMKTGGLWDSLSPKTRALYEATYFAGLRKAGMPEE
jgi:TolB-like protein/class 3 adenylate cyclase/Tfp pilus assembly protein PilF